MSVEQTIRTQLIPLADDRLLLPNTAVAEVAPYQKHQTLEDVPSWLLGNVEWRGQTIPLVSFDTLLGKPLPEADQHTRIIVLNTLTGNQTLPFFAILAQGIPHLLRVDETTLAEAENEVENDFVLSTVTVEEKRAMIPDLNRLEQAISEAY